MTKKQQQRLNEHRIQRAITGLMIPMLKIPALYKHAEKLIADGANDIQLRVGIEQFLV